MSPGTRTRDTFAPGLVQTYGWPLFALLDFITRWTVWQDLGVALDLTLALTRHWLSSPPQACPGPLNVSA